MHLTPARCRQAHCSVELIRASPRLPRPPLTIWGRRLETVLQRTQIHCEVVVNLGAWFAMCAETPRKICWEAERFIVVVCHRDQHPCRYRQLRTRIDDRPLPINDLALESFDVCNTYARVPAAQRQLRRPRSRRGRGPRCWLTECQRECNERGIRSCRYRLKGHKFQFGFPCKVLPGMGECVRHRGANQAIAAHVPFARLILIFDEIKPACQALIPLATIDSYGLECSQTGRYFLNPDNRGPSVAWKSA